MSRYRGFTEAWLKERHRRNQQEQKPRPPQPAGAARPRSAGSPKAASRPAKRPTRDKPNKPISAYEELLAGQLQLARLPGPEREFRFDPGRRWRLDFAWPGRMIAAEVHGGIWKMGRHNRPLGFANDRAKMNAATAAGWRVLEFVPDDIKSGRALGMLEALLRP